MLEQVGALLAFLICKGENNVAMLKCKLNLSRMKYNHF